MGFSRARRGDARIYKVYEMKNVIAGLAVFGVMASASFAGGLDAPVEDNVVMAPELIVEESTASSGSAADMILPLVTMALLAASVIDG